MTTVIRACRSLGEAAGRGVTALPRSLVTLILCRLKPTEEHADVAKKPAAKNAPSTPATPGKAAPAKSAPVKSAPVKSAPVKSAPVKSAPVKSAPVKSAPVKSAPVKSAKKMGSETPAPVKAAPAKAAPVKAAKHEKAPEAKAAKAVKAPAEKVEPAPAAKRAKKAETKPAKNTVMAKPEAPAKPAKSTFDAKFLKEQRELLLSERAKLRHQADVLEGEAAALMEDLDPGDVQFDDESGEGDSLVVERERDLALSAQARDMIASIDAALVRLDAGTYGVSLISGRPIPRERLQAIPWATELVEEKVGGFGTR